MCFGEGHERKDDMGAIDTEGKIYLSSNTIFADLFNYYLYGGKQVIKPDKLKELDTTQIAIPYGNGARVPVQKYRDILKLWTAMTDQNAIYVVMGAEVQHKKNKTANWTVNNGAPVIKLTSEEFLSGFRKGDKLIPIITATIFLSDEKWDGPMNLHDMIDVKDKNLLKFIPDFPINLIAPGNMTDADFGKFRTDLGFALKILKRQNIDADRLIEETNHRKIDRKTAMFLNAVTKLQLEFDEKEEMVDMCQAMENRDQKMKILGVIEYMRDEGKSENDIVSKIMEKYNVTKEYVLAILAPKTI